MLMAATSRPDVVAKDAKRPSSIGKNWEDAIDTIRDGKELLEKCDKLSLESQHFVRAGQRHQSSMIFLQMINAEFVEDGADWPVVIKETRRIHP